MSKGGSDGRTNIIRHVSARPTQETYLGRPHQVDEDPSSWDVGHTTLGTSQQMKLNERQNPDGIRGNWRPLDVAGTMSDWLPKTISFQEKTGYRLLQPSATEVKDGKYDMDICWSNDDGTVETARVRPTNAPMRFYVNDTSVPYLPTVEETVDPLTSERRKHTDQILPLPEDDQGDEQVVSGTITFQAETVGEHKPLPFEFINTDFEIQGYSQVVYKRAADLAEWLKTHDSNDASQKYTQWRDEAVYNMTFGGSEGSRREVTASIGTHFLTYPSTTHQCDTRELRNFGKAAPYDNTGTTMQIAWSQGPTESLEDEFPNRRYPRKNRIGDMGFDCVPGSDTHKELTRLGWVQKTVPGIEGSTEFEQPHGVSIDGTSENSVDDGQMDSDGDQTDPEGWGGHSHQSQFQFQEIFGRKHGNMKPTLGNPKTEDRRPAPRERQRRMRTVHRANREGRSMIGNDLCMHQMNQAV